MTAGRTNASASMTTSGDSRRISAINHSQKGKRLGVRVVDPEDAHPVADPEPHDVAKREPQPRRVATVEVERVDVWYCLGGFSAYRIDPSDRCRNHSGARRPRDGRGCTAARSRARPRAPDRLGGGDELVEVVDGAETGSTAV